MKTPQKYTDKGTTAKPTLPLLSEVSDESFQVNYGGVFIFGFHFPPICLGLWKMKTLVTVWSVHSTLGYRYVMQM